MKRPLLLLSLVLALLLIASTAFAMSSTNFRLDWYELLTGAGGPHLTSTHYAVDITAGQSAIAASTSTNYAARMGFWSAFIGSRNLLPLIRRN